MSTQNLRQYISNVAYPKGTILYVDYDANPGDIYGGVWQELHGVFLLGSGTLSATETGGQINTSIYTHSHVFSHAHDNLVSAGSHNHNWAGANSAVNYKASGRHRLRSYGKGDQNGVWSSASGDHTHTLSFNSTNATSGIINNVATIVDSGDKANLPPFHITHIWERVE